MRWFRCRGSCQFLRRLSVRGSLVVLLLLPGRFDRLALGRGRGGCRCSPADPFEPAGYVVGGHGLVPPVVCYAVRDRSPRARWIALRILSVFVSCPYSDRTAADRSVSDRSGSRCSSPRTKARWEMRPDKLSVGRLYCSGVRLSRLLTGTVSMPRTGTDRLAGVLS